MVALFLDDNETNDDGDGKENGKKYMFMSTNNNFARASRYFVHFFAVVAPLRHWKRPNFTSPLHGVGEQNTKVFSVLNLDNARHGPKENFAKLNEIE